MALGSVSLVLLTIIILIVVFLLRDIRKPHDYPPGPQWFPIVGMYPQMRRLLAKHGYYHVVWQELAQRYGAVVGLRLCQQRVVVASGLEAVRQALTKADFEGRPDGFLFRLRCRGERLGVVFTEGSHWQEQRRFVVRQLKNMGMETCVAAQAAALVASLKERVEAEPNRPLAMENAFDLSVLNSLWTLVAGAPFEAADERLPRLLRALHDCFRQTDSSGGALNHMPALRFVAPDRCGYTSTLANLNTLRGFLEETIEQHAKTRVPERPRDLIDDFLDKESAQTEGSTFTENQLLSLLLDLFMAGAETTSNTLAFCVLFLLRHPDVQRRAHAELDRVVGREREPCLQDRAQLSFLEAVLMETQRLANIAPVGVPHRALKDATLMGYFVPRDTIVLASLTSVHMDRAHWGDPERFRPDRFLDDAGIIKSTGHFMPFGTGKRRCLGETLARSTLFLNLAHLLHRFELKPSADHPVSDPIADRLFLDGFTLTPKPFVAVLTPRPHAAPQP